MALAHAICKTVLSACEEQHRITLGCVLAAILFTHEYRREETEQLGPACLCGSGKKRHVKGKVRRVIIDLTTVNSRTNGMQCLPAERAMTTLWYSFTESGDYVAMLRCLYVCATTYTCFQVELHSAQVSHEGAGSIPWAGGGTFLSAPARSTRVSIAQLYLFPTRLVALWSS